jgi:hypothetical protein
MKAYLSSPNTLRLCSADSMRAYDDELLTLLGPELGNEPVFHVGLGAHDFQFAFGRLRAQNYLQVDFHLQGSDHTWNGGPCAIPAWLLIGQVPNSAFPESATALAINFASGDWLRLHTDQGPYESQIFEFPDREGSKVMQIY